MSASVQTYKASASLDSSQELCDSTTSEQLTSLYVVMPTGSMPSLGLQSAAHQQLEPAIWST